MAKSIYLGIGIDKDNPHLPADAKGKDISPKRLSPVSKAVKAESPSVREPLKQVLVRWDTPENLRWQLRAVQTHAWGIEGVYVETLPGDGFQGLLSNPPEGVEAIEARTLPVGVITKGMMRRDEIFHQETARACCGGLDAKLNGKAWLKWELEGQAIVEASLKRRFPIKSKWES